MMLSERYSTCSSTGTRRAAAHDAEADGGPIALFVGDRVLAAVNDGHHGRRHLDVVAREQGHCGEDAEEPEQDRQRDSDCSRFNTHNVHWTPPGAACPAG